MLPRMVFQLNKRVRVRHVEVGTSVWALGGRTTLRHWTISVDKKLVDTALTKRRALSRAKRIIASMK